MYEEAITQLETMGVPFVENEDGSIDIDVADQDGSTVVEIIGFLNDNMIDYAIAGSTITVSSIGEVEEEAMGMNEDMTAMAEEELLGML